jgi:hypothetical protein
LLASSRDSKQAIQQVCNFIATSKVFLPALQGCQGLLPFKFGPPATAEAAASFAGKIRAEVAWNHKHLCSKSVERAFIGVLDE